MRIGDTVKITNKLVLGFLQNYTDDGLGVIKKIDDSEKNPYIIELNTSKEEFLFAKEDIILWKK